MENVVAFVTCQLIVAACPCTILAGCTLIAITAWGVGFPPPPPLLILPHPAKAMHIKTRKISFTGRIFVLIGPMALILTSGNCDVR